jgi:hypothetical protein
MVFFRARGLLAWWKPFGAQSQIGDGGSNKEGEAAATDQQPIACTLTAGDLRDRLAWIAALNRDELRGYDHAGLMLRLRYSPQARQQVAELMRQEQACCTFLTFEMHEDPDAVTLTIKAPEEARTAVDVLFEAFLVAKEPSPQP